MTLKELMGYEETKLINTLPSRSGSYILSHSERIKNEVINQIRGFYNNSFYYEDTDSTLVHKKH